MAPKKRSHFTALAVIVLAAAALIIERAEAERHRVGDSTGWTNTVPANFYTSWAANHTFKVGDILVFEFTTGRHDVATLAKEAYEACNTTNLLTVPKLQGPANYSLNETGDFYFICAFPGHCGQGQKLSIKVTAGAAPPAHSPSPSPSAAKTPSSSPSPTTAGTKAPPPPQGSAATSFAATTFATIFMSIAIILYQLF